MKWIRRLFFWFVGLVVLYVLFTLIAPPIVENSRNKTVLAKPYSISKEAKEFVASLSFIGDLHCDALLWDRKLHKRSDYGHVDFPRMQEGNAAFQAFTIVTKSPAGQNFSENSDEAFDNITPLSIGQGQPISTWFSLVERAVYQCEKLHRFANKAQGKVIVVKNKSDFQDLVADRDKGKNTIGGMLGIEGGHCLEGELKNLQKIYESGVRMLGPAHFFDNEMGGSAHGVSKGGLSIFGKEVLREMQKKGMIMDVAHASEAVIDEVLEIYKGPILTSHSGVDGTYPSLRNLSDKHIRAIAKRDGIIGVAYFPGAIGNKGIAGIVDAMKYTMDLVGVEHVALGSDYDGSVTVPFDITGMGLLVDEMWRQGFSNGEIKAIMGDNLKQFLIKNLPE